jgi:hypothetical protein
MAMGGLSGALLVTGFAFAIGYLLALLWHQRQLPVLSNDAITYHLPAAVQWLQTGRLGLYPAWFYNPANSYSPLGGSVFIAWLMAPMGNDVLARFVQVGPALLLLVAMLNLCRRLGAGVGVAALVAAAVVLARPLMSQTILTKDDLFVAAFFVLTLDAMIRPRLDQQRVGPWRIGIALGLLLATKYTVLLSLPILLLMLGRGWTWRRAAIVLACAIVLAGPWYLRNWIRVGNPLYPTTVKVAGVTIFHGMLNVRRSDLLATPRGAWNVFTGGYYAMPPALAVVLIVALVGGVAVAVRRRRLAEPLVRTCLFGPVIGIALFVLLAPYGEMRFAYPSLVLLFAALAIALLGLPMAMQVGLAIALVLVAAMTAFLASLASGFTLAGAVAAGVALLAWRFWSSRLVRTIALAGLATAAVMGSLMMMYHYVRLPKDQLMFGWRVEYGPVADVWAFVRNELPAGGRIAYANTFFTYPLQGFAYDHRVVHAPTRAGLERFTGMPPIAQPVTGEQIVSAVCALLRQDPDRAQWLRRLRDSGATYLVVMKQDPSAPNNTITPPELTFAAQEPTRFTKVFDNEAGTVFRVTW